MKPALPPLEGARVTLRPLTRDDLPLTRAWRNRDDVRVWFLHPEPLTEEGHAAWFAAYEARADDHVLVIVERATGRRVGQVALYRIDPKAATAEYGRLLLGEPDVRGKGLALEATNLVLDLAFGTFGLKEVRLEVLRDNARARALYRSLGFVERGEDERCVRMSLTRRAPPVAAPPRPRPAARPRVVAVVPGFIPSVWLCIVRPLGALHRAGAIDLHLTTEWLARPRDLRDADLLVLCRNAEPSGLWLLREARRRGVRVIYDVDDNFFDIAPTSAVGRYYRAPARQAAHASFLRAADLVRTYSRPVEAHARDCNPRVRRVLAPAYLPRRAAAARGGGRPRIVYATSRTAEDPLAAVFAPALRRVLDEVGEGVEVTFWGNRPAGLRDRPNVRVRAFEPDYDAFLEAFGGAGFDIGLAPLHDDVFHRSKTNNKYREYGACRVAGIYSAVDVYTDCVEHERTGLLVPNTTEAWAAAILRLVRDPGLRGRIQDEAERHVRAEYAPERYAAGWLEDIREVLDRPEADPGQEPPWIAELPDERVSLGAALVQHLRARARDEAARLRVVRDRAARRATELRTLAALRLRLFTDRPR
ncbi:MAG: GNAT family N-acetyltransferase [Planctomycetes bacterium]|nr:GNAT family N-acetyltransferase [Planctomycetota bacterium]